MEAKLATLLRFSVSIRNFEKQEVGKKEKVFDSIVEGDAFKSSQILLT